jgi:hypothetical protein
LSPDDVVPADPDSLTVAVCPPVSRPPDVIGPPDVVPSTTSIIWPIAYRDRDGAWGGDIARGGTGITGSVWAITRITAPVRATSVTSVIWTGPVSSPVRTAVIVGAPTCTERDRNYEEQESRPSRSRFRSNLGGDLRVINNVRFHIMV